MAKKFGSFVFVAALTGAVAGVISYLYKYQKFSEAVDKDFDHGGFKGGSKGFRLCG